MRNIPKKKKREITSSLSKLVHFLFDKEKFKVRGWCLKSNIGKTSLLKHLLCSNSIVYFFTTRPNLKLCHMVH